MKAALTIVCGVFGLTLSSLSQAEWTYVTSAQDDKIMLYVDLENIIKVSKSDVRVWLLASYPEYEGTKKGEDDKSYKSLISYDCLLANSITLANFRYSEGMGGGEITYSSDNDPFPSQKRKYVISDSGGFDIYKTVCDEASSIF